MFLNREAFLFKWTGRKVRGVRRLLGFLGQVFGVSFRVGLGILFSPGPEVILSAGPGVIDYRCCCLGSEEYLGFPRPFTQENVRLLIAHHADSAFPSKHSSAAFTIAFGIFLRRKRIGALFLALASLVAVSG